MPFQEGVPQWDSIQVVRRLSKFTLGGSYQIIGNIIVTKQLIWDLIERGGYKLFKDLYLVEQVRRFSSGREERGQPVNLVSTLSNQIYMTRWREKIERVVREWMKYTSPFQINILRTFLEGEKIETEAGELLQYAPALRRKNPEKEEPGEDKDKDKDNDKDKHKDKHKDMKREE